MVFNIIVPEINNKPRNTKDAVISILTTDWPLTLRAIFYGIKKRYGYSSSYQAVYKAIKELLEEEVVIGEDKKYSLNIEWAKKLQSLTDIIETNYYAKSRINNLSGINDANHGGEIIILNFDTLFDAEKYLYYFMKNELLKIKSDTICWSENYRWQPIYYLRAEYNYYKKFIGRNHKFYFTGFGKSALEKECIEFYKSLGIKFRHSSEELANDMLVFGNYVITIFIPEDIKKNMSRLLMESNKTKLLTEVLEKKSSIRVMINHDKELAEQIKKQTIRRF
jgi:hypothetical protein